ncbi:hypothetical protein ACVWW4_000862 [Bradyrhizobium sp. LB7.1]
MGHNRTKPSAAAYRAFVAVLEQRRVELGLTTAHVNDLAGLQDGFFAKLTNPDSPSGRQAGWDMLDLVMETLFGTTYQIHITAKNYKAPPKLETRALPSTKTAQHQPTHWRHRRIFQDLGRRGARALNNLPPERRSEIAKKAAATRLAKRRAAAAANPHGGREACVGDTETSPAQC